jgi:hypothetical protein
MTPLIENERAPNIPVRRIGVREVLLLAALTGGAVVIHGNHGGHLREGAPAREWKDQVDACRGWKQLQRPDFLGLKARYGAYRVVLQQPGARALSCPYQYERVPVCRIA